MRTLACLTALLLLAHAAGTRADDDKGTEITLDKLKSTTPANWKTAKPAFKFRIHQFTIPKAEGEDADTEVVISYLGKDSGGDIESNLKRWKGMFQPPQGKTIEDVSKVASYKVGPINYTYLDVHGSYITRVPPFAQNAKEVRHPDYRMLNVYFDTGNGPYFLRMVGPAKTVEKNKKGFDEWLKNFK